MQETRKQILEVLNHRGQATVDEIVTDLQERRGDQITAVTVRHHLTRLQKDNLINCPEIRHRNKPGRPQHVYVLTEKAHQHFPSNYQAVTLGLLTQIRKQLPPDHINVIIDGMADDMAAAADIPDLPLRERLNLVVEYLNAQGYDAHWETQDADIILHTSNCPYHEVSKHDEALCRMDMRLIASLVGIVPRRVERISDGNLTCSYLFPQADSSSSL